MKASNLLKEIIKYFNSKGSKQLVLKTHYFKDSVNVSLDLENKNFIMADLVTVTGDKEDLEKIYSEVLDSLLEFNMFYLENYNELIDGLD